MKLASFAILGILAISGPCAAGIAPLPEVDINKTCTAYTASLGTGDFDACVNAQRKAQAGVEALWANTPLAMQWRCGAALESALGWVGLENCVSRAAQ